MKLVAPVPLLLAGCSSLFGLEAPVLVDASGDGPAFADADVGDAGMVDAMPDAPGATACPASYTLAIGTSRYRRITTNMEWLPAAQQCAADAANGTKRTHLVVIGDNNERTSIAMMTGFESVWIGLSDRLSEGTYRWVTAEPTSGYPPAIGSPPWGPNEPSNALGQDCVVVQGGLMADANCSGGADVLCECDDFADDPSRYN